MKASANGGRDVSVLVCRGNLDANSMIRLKNTLARLLHQKRRRLILDLAHAERADCSGLGIFIDRLKKVRAMHGDIRMINVKPTLSRTFDMLGVNRMVETFDSKQEAIESYHMAAA